MWSRVRALAARTLRATFPPSWGTLSFSQEGEDIALARYFGHRRNGFYVDIGSHHPFRFSNTYLLYRLGWRGICVDPLPGSARLFQRWRPRDVALELGVSSAPAHLTYYMFNDAALNTFDRDLAMQRDGTKNYRVIDRIEVRTEPLADILHRHMPNDASEIQLLTVDAEGLDIDILESNDWSRYRPEVVVAEVLDPVLSAVATSRISELLSSVGYAAYAKTGKSVIFTNASLS